MPDASPDSAPKLDRLIQFDDRSRAFPIRTLVADKPRRSYTWRVGVSLDQGNEGACVGFGWAHELAARPVVRPMTDQIAFGLYYEAQKLDIWPGEDYEGTSVIAGAKAVQAHNWLQEYRWAFSENDLALAVGYKGPAVLGTWWYSGMDTLERDSVGRLWASVDGYIRGGHCYIAHGYSIKLNAYKCWNSWGSPSEFWVTASDMAKLLANQGEACIPIKRT